MLLGQQRLALTHALAVGQAASLFVRPEDVILHAHWPASADAALADITKLELLGPIYRVSLTVAAWGQARLQADVTHSQLATLGLALAQRVPVSLDPSRLRLFTTLEACA